MCGWGTAAKSMCLCECCFHTQHYSKCGLLLQVWKCISVPLLHVCVLAVTRLLVNVYHLIYHVLVYLPALLIICFLYFPGSKPHPAIGLRSIQTRLYSTHSRKLWTSMTPSCLVRSLTQTHLAATLLSLGHRHAHGLPARTHAHTHTHPRCLARRRSHETHRGAQWLAALTRTPFRQQR